MDHLLSKIQHTYTIDHLSSDDITDGPRPEYLKLMYLHNRIDLMSHKMYLDSKLECIRTDNNIITQEDYVCTPSEFSYIRQYDKQIKRIMNSKVTQT